MYARVSFYFSFRLSGSESIPSPEFQAASLPSAKCFIEKAFQKPTSGSIFLPSYLRWPGAVTIDVSNISPQFNNVDTYWGWLSVLFFFFCNLSMHIWQPIKCPEPSFLNFKNTSLYSAVPARLYINGPVRFMGEVYAGARVEKIT